MTQRRRGLAADELRDRCARAQSGFGDELPTWDALLARCAVAGVSLDP